MYVSKEKTRRSTAIEVTSTSANVVTESIANDVKSVTSAACAVPSCNTDKDTCICWTKLLSDSPADSTRFCSNEQRRVNWSKRYHWYHEQQQTIKKLHSGSDSQIRSAIVKFDNYSQSGKYLLLSNERLLLTSRSNGNNSSAREEEESCCFSRERIVYQSYRDLRCTSTQQYNTASSSLSSSIRSQNPTIHHYRYQQRSRCILYANLKLFIYWHAFSLLACFAATGLCVRAAISESFLNDMKHTENDIPDIPDLLQQSLKYTASISTSATTADNLISTRPNPFLRHSRSTSVRLGLSLDSVCYIWSSMAPLDLCKLAPWARYQFLRKISIFNRDCLEENNIKAAQLFRLTPRYVNDEADLRMRAKFLRANVEGQDCILAPAGAQQCLSCFQKIDRGLKKVDKAYENFNLTLHRFDCMLAVDTASATRPFSPNGSCTDCKVNIWYRKWLVVNLLNLWSVPPCINWCYYVQLACPHLATSKVVDYAGHPSFQCRDLHIPSVGVPRDPDLVKSTTLTSSFSKKKSVVASKCACLHPCDLEEFYSLVDVTRTAQQNRPNSYSNTILMTSDEDEDFFPSHQHCMVRHYLCGSLKDEIEGHRVTRRSSTTSASAVGENLPNFKLDDVSLSSYVIGIANFMRSPDSTGAVPHRQDSTIQETFTDPVGYVSEWWTKHRARRSQFNEKTVTTVATNNFTPTTAPVTIGSSTPTTIISSGVDWRGTKWSICSGIFIYTLHTLFSSLLLLRRPPLL
ncbi:unnamed protein product [Brugia pahangi]|uniref:Uncharacterized protein n=1 Tax=Brugia pahangi TaxID=6280 RepID=A0A0N4SZA5_BRUPA|nr:unnamed protein product [Brugia pahangi]